tara:strand:+ start:565 stop:717 length:153 start_codon:yes stop_codon:yes gene_type:complete
MPLKGITNIILIIDVHFSDYHFLPAMAFPIPIDPEILRLDTFSFFSDASF